VLPLQLAAALADLGWREASIWQAVAASALQVLLQHSPAATHQPPAGSAGTPAPEPAAEAAAAEAAEEAAAAEVVQQRLRLLLRDVGSAKAGFLAPDYPLLAGALARVQLADPQLLALLAAAAVPRLPLLAPAATAQLLEAYVQLGAAAPRLAEAAVGELVARARRGGFASRDAVQLLRCMQQAGALLRLQLGDPGSDSSHAAELQLRGLMQPWQQAALPAAGQMSPADTAGLLTACADLGMVPTALLLRLARRMLAGRWAGWAPQQAAAAARALAQLAADGPGSGGGEAGGGGGGASLSQAAQQLVQLAAEVAVSADASAPVQQAHMLDILWAAATLAGERSDAAPGGSAAGASDALVSLASLAVSSAAVRPWELSAARQAELTWALRRLGQEQLLSVSMAALMQAAAPARGVFD